MDDVQQLPEPFASEPIWWANAELEGIRTVLNVPLAKDERYIGCLTVYRREMRRFTDKEIALLQTFADQAVIAIENVRLFNETKETLERQTAISEIVEKISASPTDMGPILQAVVERAAHLCRDAHNFNAVTHYWLGTAGIHTRVSIPAIEQKTCKRGQQSYQQPRRSSS